MIPLTVIPFSGFFCVTYLRGFYDCNALRSTPDFSSKREQLWQLFSQSLIAQEFGRNTSSCDVINDALNKNKIKLLVEKEPNIT